MSDKESESLNISQLLRIDQHSDKTKSEEGSNGDLEFVKDYMPLIEKIAKSVIKFNKLPIGVELGDLMSWGVEGIVKAKSKFNESKGAQFKTYASIRIKGEMLDNIRKEWNIRSPQAYKKHKDQLAEKIAAYVEDSINNEKGETLDSIFSRSMMMYMVSLDDMNVDSDGSLVSSYEVIDESQNQSADLLALEEYNIMWSTVASLEEPDKSVVELFYKHNKSQKDIAAELNLSRSKVCRIHSKVLDQLKRKLEKEYYHEDKHI